MPNRKAPACRGGLSLREKDEDDEERSHPGPIQSTVAPPPDCIHARARRSNRFTPLRQGKGERRPPASRECLGSFEDTLKLRLPPEGKNSRRKTRLAGIHGQPPPAKVSVAGTHRERARSAWRHSTAAAPRRAGGRRAAFFHRADGFLGLTAFVTTLQPFRPGELR